MKDECKINHPETDKIRKEINKINLEIIRLIKKRMKISLRLLEIKKKLGFNLRDKKREKIVINNMGDEAVKNGLSKKFGRKLFKLIIKENVRNLKKVEGNLKWI